MTLYVGKIVMWRRVLYSFLGIRAWDIFLVADLSVQFMYSGGSETTDFRFYIFLSKEGYCIIQ